MISSMMMIGNDTLRMCFHSSCGCVRKALDPINTQPRRGTRQAAHLAQALAHRTPATPKIAGEGLPIMGRGRRKGQVPRGQAQPTCVSRFTWNMISAAGQERTA